MCKPNTHTHKISQWSFKGNMVPTRGSFESRLRSNTGDHPNPVTHVRQHRQETRNDTDTQWLGTISRCCCANQCWEHTTEGEGFAPWRRLRTQITRCQVKTRICNPYELLDLGFDSLCLLMSRPQTRDGSHLGLWMETAPMCRWPAPFQEENELGLIKFSVC